MKKRYVILVLCVTFVFFQNFRKFQNNSLVAVHIDPDDMKYSADGHDIVDVNDSASNHEIKTQVKIRGIDEEADSRHLTPTMNHLPRLGQKVFKFETQLNTDMERTRSEIRVRDMEIPFSDRDSDSFYYVKFEIYVPHLGGLNNLPKDNSVWNIIWQVAQIGSDINSGFWRNTSPPLSLQMYGRSLYIQTFHDYRRTRYIDLKNWSRNKNEIGDYQSYRYEVPPMSSGLNYAGYLKKNAWNKVFIKFKMGKYGYVAVRVNDEKTLERSEPIGYQLASDPFDPNPKLEYVDSNGTTMYTVKKRASTRFGLYQGNKLDNPSQNHHSLTFIKYYSIGNDWTETRWGLDDVNP